MKRSKGITLIALVITIIVLLILAGVSILLTLGNNGILNQATNAVEANRDAKAKEEVEIAWAGATSDYLSDLSGDLNTISDEDFYTQKLNDYLADTKKENVQVKDNNDGTFKVTYVTKDQGRTYEFIMKDGMAIKPIKWKLEEDGTFSGNIKGIQVGDYINYDCYTGVKAEDLYYKSLYTSNGYNDQEFQVTEADKTMRWKVLGVNDNENLLIIPAEPFKTKTGDKFILYKREGYSNGPSELNNISKIYGYGKGSVQSEARSMKLEDVDQITGYEATAGAVHTYTKDGIIYRDDTSESTKSRLSTYTCWYYKNDNPSGEWQSLAQGETTTDITGLYYSYTIDATTNALKMLIYGIDGTTRISYFLSSQFTSFNWDYLCYNIPFINGYGLCDYAANSDGGSLYWSKDRGNTSSQYIRPVITLTSSVELEANGTYNDINCWKMK